MRYPARKRDFSRHQPDRAAHRRPPMAKAKATRPKAAPAPAGITQAPSPATGIVSRREPIDLGRALVEAYLTNERINQVLLEILDPGIWRTQPPCSKRRNIATTFA